MYFNFFLLSGYNSCADLFIFEFLFIYTIYIKKIYIKKIYIKKMYI
jgi:hypothetical protein